MFVKVASGGVLGRCFAELASMAGWRQQLLEGCAVGSWGQRSSPGGSAAGSWGQRSTLLMGCVPGSWAYTRVSHGSFGGGGGLCPLAFFFFSFFIDGCLRFVQERPAGTVCGPE